MLGICGWGSEIPVWPMQDVEQVFPKYLLSCSPSGPQRLLKEHSPVFSDADQKTQGEGEEGRRLLWTGRAWSLESTSGASRLLSPSHMLETTISPTGLRCWQWPGQQRIGPSQLASSTTLF